MDRTVASLSLMFSLALTACDHPPAPVELRAAPASQVYRQGKPNIYPEQHWKSGLPSHHGLSTDGVSAMAEVAQALDSTCMMVIHDGILIGEWYAEGYGPDTIHDNLFSITKSVTSTLVGIAHGQGLLALDDDASEYIDPWMGTPSQSVTLRDLLSNVSGRYWSFESDYGYLMYSADQTGYGVGLDQAVEPGEVWEYNNSAVQTLEAVLGAATGEDVEAFAQAQLFERIGMTATMARDPADNPLVYQGLSTSCADIARFGYLMLRQGKWRNQQVVPKAWVMDATKPSTALNDAYGYLWWLNREGHVVEPSFPGRSEYDGKLIPAGSDSTFFAMGVFGQFVAVDPVGEYVIVRLQNVTDMQATLAVDPDPVGLSKVEAMMTAFAAAKVQP